MAKVKVAEGEWLELGLKYFGERGAEGINVERMSRALKCAKTSFYWAFGDRRKYLARLLEYWREAETRAFIAAAERESSPTLRIQRLFSEVVEHRKYGDLLFHLRKTAERNAAFAEAVAEVERERVAYLASLLRQMGDSEAVAVEKSGALYHFYLGWYERHKNAEVGVHEVRALLPVVSRILGVNLKFEGRGPDEKR